jgi:hypothetical protein
VAESGSGGPAAPGNCIQSPEGGEACFGRTGAVTRITKRGQHQVLTGLPSLAEAGGVAASGPVDLGFSGWTGYLLVGNPGGGTGTREQFGPAARRFGKLLKVDHEGRISVVAVSRRGSSRPRRGSPDCRPSSPCRPCRPRSSRAPTAPTTSAS